MPDATYAELYVACRMLQMARSSHTSHSYAAGSSPQRPAGRPLRARSWCAAWHGSGSQRAAAAICSPRPARDEATCNAGLATRGHARSARRGVRFPTDVNRQRVDDGRTDGPPRVVLQCSAPSRHGFPLSGITRGSRLTRRVLTRAQVTGFAVAITFGCLYLIRRALERV